MNRKLQNSIKSQVEKNYYRQDFNVNSLAATLTMDRVTLYRHCLLFFDKYPQKIIEEFRLERASVLLKNPDIPIKEVAHATGFTYVNYFSRRFKNHYSKTPNDYRKNATKVLAVID